MLILLAATLGLIVANTPLSQSYFDALHHAFNFSLGCASHAITVHNLINDLLMSFFFYLVGLEIKRELTTGHLNSLKKALMPFLAALGGMALPALIYIAIAGRTNLHGWGIPVATDIALALGLLAIVGKGTPSSLRAFLLALAVIDDIGAIIIIALVYASGVHPTLIAVALGALTPNIKVRKSGSLVKLIERKLNPIVTFAIVPLFAFANTGIKISLDSFHAALSSPIAWGIFFGLIVGKPIGIVTAALISHRIQLAELPAGVSKKLLWATGSAAGIGFTVSIFIAQLAFDDPTTTNIATLAVIAASIASALISSLAFRLNKN